MIAGIGPRDVPVFYAGAGLGVLGSLLLGLSTPVVITLSLGAGLMAERSWRRVGQKALQKQRELEAKRCAGVRTICPTNGQHPNPLAGPAQKGMASSLTYPWCHKVKKDDTAGAIAERVTGDRRRYLELLAANTDRPQGFVTDASGKQEWNFTEKPCAGEVWSFPPEWGPWMDQLGNPSGKPTPFPPFNVLPPYPVATPSSSSKPAKGYLPGPDFTWVPR